MINIYIYISLRAMEKKPRCTSYPDLPVITLALYACNAIGGGGALLLTWLKSENYHGVQQPQSIGC